MAKNRSLRQKEILCLIDAGGHKKVINKQKEQAQEISLIYKNGSKETLPDKWRAWKFAKITNPKVKPPGSTFFRSKKLYNLFWYFNDLRLKLSYSNSAANLVGLKFLPRWYGIFGCAYGLRLIADIIAVFYKTFKSPDEEEINYSRWERFKIAASEKKRRQRMLNDLIWLPINLLCCIFWGYAAVAIGLTLAGFSIDFTTALYQTYSGQNPHADLVKQLDDEIRNAKPNGKTDADIAVLRYQRDQVQKQLVDVRTSSLYGLFAVTLILSGAALSMFPLTSVAGIIILGLGSALVLGPAIKKRIGKWAKKLTDHNPAPIDEEIAEVPIYTPARIEKSPSKLRDQETHLLKGKGGEPSCRESGNYSLAKNDLPFQLPVDMSTSKSMARMDENASRRPVQNDISGLATNNAKPEDQSNPQEKANLAGNRSTFYKNAKTLPPMNKNQKLTPSFSIHEVC